MQHAAPLGCWLRVCTWPCIFREPEAHRPLEESPLGAEIKQTQKQHSESVVRPPGPVQSWKAQNKDSQQPGASGKDS